jgi:hypothetical protein
VDDRIRELLKQLGQAINDSISGSADVNAQIQKLKDEGYNLYVVLDATIGLGKDDGNGEPEETTVKALAPIPKERKSSRVLVDPQFRINAHDLSVLRSMGIDPTRRVKVTRRLEPGTSSTEE